MKKYKLPICQIRLIIAFLALWGCNNPEEAWPVLEKKDNPSGKYANGILIINEGNFGWGYGTLSFYQKATKTVEHEIFRAANDRILGNVVQSATRLDTLIYIVVNNSKKIEIVSAFSMQSLGKIEGLVSPRYLVFSDGKAYCTDIYSGYISILKDNKVIDKIQTGTWTERMVVVGDKIFVEDKSGFILVLLDNKIKTKIKTDGSPNGLTLWQNQVWTLSNDSLLSINPQSETITKKWALPASPNRARIVVCGADDLWILFGNIWKFDGNDFTLFFEGKNKNLYALAAKDKILAFADVKDYVSPSEIYLFDNYAPLDTLQGGVITGEIDLNFY